MVAPNIIHNISETKIEMSQEKSTTCSYSVSNKLISVLLKNGFSTIMLTFAWVECPLLNWAACGDSAQRCWHYHPTYPWVFRKKNKMIPSDIGMFSLGNKSHAMKTTYLKWLRHSTRWRLWEPEGLELHHQLCTVVHPIGLNALTKRHRLVKVTK